MSNGFTAITESQVAKYSPAYVMELAEMNGIDTDDDIEEIRRQVADIMSRKNRDIERE